MEVTVPNTTCTMEIVHSTYNPPATKDIVQITVNIRRCRIKDFWGGGDHSSSDEKEEDVKRLWGVLGMSPPKQFTSCAARVIETKDQNFGVDGYGPVVLLLDPQKIKADTIIVNGDFQNLAVNKIQKSDIVKMYIHDADLADKLNKLARDSRVKLQTITPQLRGNYFEARVMRPITCDDVLKLYTGSKDPQVWADMCNGI